MYILRKIYIEEDEKSARGRLEILVIEILREKRQISSVSRISFEVIGDLYKFFSFFWKKEECTLFQSNPDISNIKKKKINK